MFRMLPIRGKNIAKVCSGICPRHVPPSPSLFEAGIMAINKILYCRERCAIGGGIDGTHQQARDINRLGAEMTLQATRRPVEPRSIRRLFQGIEDGTSSRIDRSQIDHASSRDPAPRNTIQKNT